MFVEDIVATNVVGVADDVPRSWHRIIVEYPGHSAALLHVVIAHEIGHGVGLDHAGHIDPQIMEATVSSNNVEQILADADAYD